MKSLLPAGNFRWYMLALVFFATTINYMDRTVLTVLAPTLQYRVFHWRDSDYASITIAFQLAYAVGLLAMGLVLDRLGTRRGYTLSIVTWAFFDLLHAAIRPAFAAVGFPIVRFGFGFGQAGTYPAAVKAVAEWFPRRERALATGIFNAGSNMGAILAPWFVALVVAPADGARWQFAFLTTGLLSVGCAVLWWNTYRRPEAQPKLSAAERAYIESDAVAEPPGTARVPWTRIVRQRETWAFAAAKLTDVAWWFYTFWIGKFFYDQFGLSLKGLALPLLIIYIAADAGSIAGGWLSSHLIQRGWSVNRARKTTLLLCALAALPVGLSTHLDTRFQFERARLPALPARALGIDGQYIALNALEGRSFASARQFLAAVDVAIGATARAPVEAVLLQSARSNRYYWIAVALIALAAAAHQGWSATIFTLVSDVFPKRAVASVVGVGGMAGALAGVAANVFLGRALMAAGLAGYSYMFFAAGALYIVVLGVVQVLTPRLAPVRFDS